MKTNDLSVIADLHSINADLRSYGEEALADRVMDASAAQHRKLLKLVPLFWDDRFNIATAAIEELSGERRLPQSLSSVAAIQRLLGPLETDADRERLRRMVCGGLTRADVAHALLHLGEKRLVKSATRLRAPQLISIQKTASRNAGLLAMNIVLAALAVFEKRPRLPLLARRRIKKALRS